MRRGRKRRRHDDGVITLLFFFFFLNAQNARTKVRLSSVVLFSLNSLSDENGKKNEEKFSSGSKMSLSDEIISKSADEKLLWLLRIIISIEEGYLSYVHTTRVMR